MNQTDSVVLKRKFAASGLTLVADTAGDPAHPPVIFLHGGGQTRSSWRAALLRVAAEGFYAVSLDLRGHGDSGWAVDGNYGLDKFADDLRAVLREVGSPAFLIGASLGGMAALLVAADSGQLAANGLVLVDIAPRLEPAGVERIRAFMQNHPEGFSSVDEAVEAVSRYLIHRPRPANTEGLRKNLRLGADGRYRWHWDPQFMDMKARSGMASLTAQLEDAASAVRIPTILIRGRLSDVLSLEGTREFLQLVPHAEFVDVEDADHMVAGDDNELFNRAILDFLRRHARVASIDV